MGDWSEAWQHLQLHFKTALLGGGILLGAAVAIGLARFVFDVSRFALGGDDKDPDKHSGGAAFVTAGIISIAVAVGAAAFGKSEDAQVVQWSAWMLAAMLLVPAALLWTARAAVRRISGAYRFLSISAKRRWRSSADNSVP